MPKRKAIQAATIACIISSSVLLASCSADTTTSTESQKPSAMPSSSQSATPNPTSTKGNVTFNGHQDMEFNYDAAKKVTQEEWIDWYNSKLKERDTLVKGKTLSVEAQSFSAPVTDRDIAEISKGLAFQLSGFVNGTEKADIKASLDVPGKESLSKAYRLLCEDLITGKCWVKYSSDKNPKWDRMDIKQTPPGASLLTFPKFEATKLAEDEYLISSNGQSSKIVAQFGENQDISFFFFNEDGSSIITKTVVDKEGNLKSDAYQKYEVVAPKDIVIPNNLK